MEKEPMEVCCAASGTSSVEDRTEEERESVETVETPSEDRAPSPLPIPFSTDETCIIFDWDDTILSSSWLAYHDLRLDFPAVLPDAAITQLAVLEDSVCALLERALKCGTVIIITNAEAGWVEMSCRRFIPRCLPVVSKIKVLSARSSFEGLHPASPADWKVHAFFQEICLAYAGRRPDSLKNVLSFGDSVHERAAVHKVTANMGPMTRTKSIKFVERPTVEQLRRQVDLVASCFDEICRHDGHLDLMLTIQLLQDAAVDGPMAEACTAGEPMQA